MKRLRDLYVVVEAPRLLYICALHTGQPSKAKAMAVFPFIIVKSKTDTPAWLITHERIHFHQQVDLLIIGSFFVTVIEYVYARLLLRLPRERAYIYCSAEQEAYLHHHDEQYLANRKWFAQVRYIRNKKPFQVKENGVIEFVE